MITAFPSHITVLLFLSASFSCFFFVLLSSGFNWFFYLNADRFLFLLASYLLKGDLFLFFCYVRYSTLLHLSPFISTMPDDAGIEPRTVTTVALTAKRSYHSARSHSFLFVAAACVVCLSISLPSAITACVTVIACLWGFLSVCHLSICVVVCLTAVC